MLRLLASLAALSLAAEVQLGDVRVVHDGQDAEANRIARSLERARKVLPAFTGASSLPLTARLSPSIEEFTARTGLPPTAAAGVVEREIVLPPARVTERFEDLDEVARHEVAHLCVLEKLGHGLPRWLSEGLAARLAGKSGASAPEWKGAACGEKLSDLDTRLVAREPAVREAAYRQALGIVRALSAAAGSDEKLWRALADEKPKLPSRRLGDHTVAETVRASTLCVEKSPRTLR